MQGTPFGRYELLRKIAAGGMAEIFLARQWGEGGFFRDVVIKRLFRHLAENERTLRMFQYEARLLSELSHPSIPQVFDLGYFDGTWFLAMEFVDGHTVADVWRAGSRTGQVMPLPVAVGVLLQACEALHHAHEQRDRAGRALRIVHRDVTPHNVMLTRDGIAKVMDFGVAQTAARRDTEAGAVKGTFSYMAPEQVRARPLDKRADVFALGVILYELTTGTRLYRGNDVQIMTAIVEQDAAPPSSRVAGYPPDLEAIVMAALRRDRAERLPSASHFAIALEDFAMRNGLAVGPRTVSRYVSAIYPYEREKEHDVALVEARRLEVVPEADISGEWDAAFDPGMSTAREMMGRGDLDEVDMDQEGMLEDLALLSPDDEAGASPAVIARPGRPPGGERNIDALLFDETTDDEAARPTTPPPGGGAELSLEGFEDDRVPGPVVLLESPRREHEEGGEYLADLERRLEEDAD